MYVEAEAAGYFFSQYEWHGKNGEYADRPGYRTLEIPSLYIDNAFPYMQAAKDNWTSKFPETAKFAATIQDPELRAMKVGQLKEGIDAGYEEIAKMTEQLMSPGEDKQWAFCLIMHPKIGSKILRVAMAIAKEEGFYIDAIHDDEGHLIDETLEWGTCAVDGRDAIYTSFMEKWTSKGKSAHVVHWLQQLGLMTSKVRNELKRLSQETEVIRDVNSSTRLLDFAATYPQTFDMFWSKMGMYPHSTRIVEQCHGVERNAYNSQASHDMRDSRTNYIANEEYANRRERRRCILEIETSKAVSTEQSKKQRTSSVKHNDRKVTQQMIGGQLLEDSKQYTTEQLAQRLPEDIRQKFSIKSIVKRGTDVGKKALGEKKVEHAESVARMKRESTTFSQTPFEDLIEDAQKLETANDLAWKSKDAIKHAKQLNTVLTKSYWNRIKVDCFFEELEKVFPCFYTPTVSRMTKTALLQRPNSACSAKNNLNLFIKLVKDIAEGKATNTLSTKRRAQQLKRAKATKLDLWAEFANVEASEYLSVVEEKAFEKNALMRDVIASFGTETTTHARFQMTKADLTTTYTTDYVPPTDDGHDDEP